MTETPLLHAEGLRYRYDNQRGVQALDLQLRQGEVLGLLGLNGAGKSTALRLLAGTLEPEAGVVSILGQRLRCGSTAGRARLGYLPEYAPLYPELTVDEQLQYGARLFGMAARAARAAAAKARARCGLDEVANRRVKALSQGMRRRLGLAQAIVHEPSVLLLDEPTVALDPMQIVQVRELIGTLSQSSAVILSSHLLHEVESVCTRVAILHQGRLVHQQSLPDRDTNSALVLGLDRDPGHTVLDATLHPASVRDLGAGRYLIEDQHLDVPRVAELALQHHWGLRELSPHTGTLERRFLALTRGDRETAL